MSANHRTLADEALGHHGMDAFDAVDGLGHAQIRRDAAKRVSLAWRDTRQDDKPVDQLP